MHGLHPVRPRRPSDPIIPKGTAALKEGLLSVWARALACVLLSLPVANPDLFWHLSAGRWMLAEGAIPRADVFSFTAYGSPWINFEWGQQLLWYAVHAAAGEWGLWGLKAALLAGAFWPVDGLLRDKGASTPARAGAAAFWAAAAIAQADLRADLPTAAFAALLLRRLESGRASFLFGFGLFALWANLHAGFAVGLAIYALYALAPRLAGGRAPEGLAPEATGAVFGSLLNPYGLEIYSVLFAHAADPSISRYVMEWGQPQWGNAFQTPLLAAIALFLAAAWMGRRRLTPPLLAVSLSFAFGASASARFGILFAAAGAAAVFSAFPRPAFVPVLTLLLAVSAAFVVPARSSLRYGLPFADRHVARAAVDHVVRERAVLGGLRLFNQYEWGGYLGWALGPGSRVFSDGRYLFLPRLAETQRALSDVGGLEALAGRWKLDGFVIKRYKWMMASTRRLKDGRELAIPRPWYFFTLPRERWALVYWDAQALVFVARDKVPAAWLAEREYRWHLPDDEPALKDARERGEIPPEALASERERWAALAAPRRPRR